MATRLISPAKRASDRERLVLLPHLGKASRMLALKVKHLTCSAGTPSLPPSLHRGCGRCVTPQPSMTTRMRAGNGRSAVPLEGVFAQALGEHLRDGAEDCLNGEVVGHRQCRCPAAGCRC